MKRTWIFCGVGLVTVTALLCAATAAWALSGAVGGGLGGTDPRGEFNKYSETSFSLYGFGILRGDQTPQVGLRLGLQYVAFDHDSRDVRVIGYPGALLKEIYSNDLGAHYDIVKDMEQYTEEEKITVDSEFLSILAGVSVTLPGSKEGP